MYASQRFISEDWASTSMRGMTERNGTRCKLGAEREASGGDRRAWRNRYVFAMYCVNAEQLLNGGRVKALSPMSRRLRCGQRYRTAAQEQMGVVFAATQESPVALGTRRIEGRELSEERISWEVPVAAQVKLQNVAFEKARRVLPQCNVNPGARRFRDERRAASPWTPCPRKSRTTPRKSLRRRLGTFECRRRGPDRSRPGL